MSHPANSDAGFCTVVTSNINVVYDPPISTMEGRRDSTATGTSVAAVPDISTIGETSSGIRSHPYQSCKTAFTRGSIHAVRRIPDRSVVVPSAELVSISTEVSIDVDVCEKSEIEVVADFDSLD